MVDKHLNNPNLFAASTAAAKTVSTTAIVSIVWACGLNWMTIWYGLVSRPPPLHEGVAMQEYCKAGCLKFAHILSSSSLNLFLHIEMLSYRNFFMIATVVPHVLSHKKWSATRNGLPDQFSC